MIEVKNLNYQYEKNNSDFVLRNVSLFLEKGSFTTLAGPNSSGKSTLVDILSGKLKTTSYIKIDNYILCNKNIKQIQNMIGVIQLEEYFDISMMIEEILFRLKSQNKKEIAKMVHDFIVELELEYLFKSNPKTLSEGEKILISFILILLKKPKIIILNDIFSLIDGNKKTKMFELLQTLNQNEHITILNVTHDLNESLYGQDIIILQSGQIILKGSTEEVLKQESKIRKAGLELPFLADLSIRLMYYGILDHMILNMDEMVNTIWK